MAIIQKPSPNQDGNRVAIDRVVIHWIAGTLASADAVFAQPGGASAHYGIEDNTIHQYVQENRVAYHCGNYPFNQRSIGIEHSAFFDRPASDATYQTSGKLLGEICKRHNIPIDRAHIIKHSQVVPTQCPGTIDLDKLISIAKQGGAVPTPPTTDKEAEMRFRAKSAADNILVDLRDRKLKDKNGNIYVPDANSEIYLYDSNDKQKFLGMIKRIINDYATLQTTQGVDVAKIKEEGRKIGVKQVQDAANKVT